MMLVAKKVAADLNLAKGFRLGTFKYFISFNLLIILFYYIHILQWSTMEKMDVSLFTIYTSMS